MACSEIKIKIFINFFWQKYLSYLLFKLLSGFSSDSKRGEFSCWHFLIPMGLEEIFFKIGGFFTVWRSSLSESSSEPINFDRLNILWNKSELIYLTNIKFFFSIKYIPPPPPHTFPINKPCLDLIGFQIQNNIFHQSPSALFSI